MQHLRSGRFYSSGRNGNNAADTLWMDKFFFFGDYPSAIQGVSNWLTRDIAGITWAMNATFKNLPCNIRVNVRKKKQIPSVSWKSDDCVNSQHRIQTFEPKANRNGGQKKRHTCGYWRDWASPRAWNDLLRSRKYYNPPGFFFSRSRTSRPSLVTWISIGTIFVLFFTSNSGTLNGLQRIESHKFLSDVNV